MPCYTTGTAEGDARLSAERAAAEVTELTRILCAVGQQAVRYGWLLRLPASFQAWWAKHEEIDQRVRKEKPHGI